PEKRFDKRGIVVRLDTHGHDHGVDASLLEPWVVDHGRFERLRRIAEVRNQGRSAADHSNLRTPIERCYFSNLTPILVYNLARLCPLHRQGILPPWRATCTAFDGYSFDRDGAHREECGIGQYGEFSINIMKRNLAMRPVVIAVAITGSVPRKKDNPALPVRPSEQIESTYEAYEAGATLVHIHVRNSDETPASDPEL